jgi:protein ImuA
MPFDALTPLGEISTSLSVSVSVPGPRQAVLEHLRGQIRKIEGAPVSLIARPEGIERQEHAGLPSAGSPAWTLGAPEIDALFGAEGLEIAGVHEIKPAVPESGSSWAAGAAAAFVFALALSARRIALPDMDGRLSAPILCCRSGVAANELGVVYIPGLRALGLDPDRFLFAEPAKEMDLLWVMEEGLKSGSLALVLGLIEDVGLTPARRLALAAATHRTPCLLLTHPQSEVAATATRWSVAPNPTAPHAFDERAPGAPRFVLRLERFRSRPAPADALSFVVEWCDEARSFRLVSRMADRSVAPSRSVRSAG